MKWLNSNILLKVSYTIYLDKYDIKDKNLIIKKTIV